MISIDKHKNGYPCRCLAFANFETGTKTWGQTNIDWSTHHSWINDEWTNNANPNAKWASFSRFEVYPKVWTIEKVEQLGRWNRVVFVYNNSCFYPCSG